MTSPNVEVVRRGYDAMQRRDIDELLRYCDPEIRFVSLVGGVVAGSRSGSRSWVTRCS